MTSFLRRYLTFAFARRRRPGKRSFTQRLLGRRGWHYFCGFLGILQKSSAPRVDDAQSGTLCDPASGFSRGDAKPVRDLMRDLERVNRSEPGANRFLHSNQNLYNPPMQGVLWSTIALGSLLLISAGSKGGQEVQ